VTDHGKLMHMFLVSNDLGAIAHLHPTTEDSVTFTTAIPVLPLGRYRVLGDIVRESGYSETLSATVAVPGMAAQSSSNGTPNVVSGYDADDSWYIGQPTGDRITLADGSTMQWMRGSAPLVTAPGGGAARLEPYMGMAAHAAVLRDDGAVFVHLHPSGTVSMAAQETFAMRRPTDTLPGMVALRMSAAKMTGGHSMHGMDTMPVQKPTQAMPVHAMAVSDTIAFPYAFPKPGRYRIWVQVKRAGKVMTGVFDAQVAPRAD
jgi:hypothetical protein